jgi:hypothetical protein
MRIWDANRHLRRCEALSDRRFNDFRNASSEARSRVGESDQFRPLPSRARLAGSDALHANCRTKNIRSAR